MGMEMAINYAKTGTASISIVLSYLFGDWSVLLGALIFFVTFDFLSGITAAAYRGKLEARVGFWGIPKKIMIFGLVAIAYRVDLIYLELMGSSIQIGELNLSVMGATILYYLVIELISIAENVGKIGNDFPTPLKKVLEMFKTKSYYDERNEEEERS